MKLASPCGCHMHPGNTILIGDIHGCSRELQELLQRLAPGASDKIVLLGDLTNKGPDPEGVLRIFESLRSVCLLGNHDSNHLKWHSGAASPKKESLSTRNITSRDVYMRYVNAAAQMPLYYENGDLIATHGAVIEQLPIHRQPARVLTGEVNLDPSWKDQIDLGRPLIVGHKRYSERISEPFVREGKFYGIDTGCVYGGCLTALIMPAARIVQVNAARDYSADGMPD